MTEYKFLFLWAVAGLGAAFTKGYFGIKGDFIYIDTTLYVGFYCLIAAIRERK